MNSKSLNNIVINVVDSQDTFDGLVDAGKVNENELWLVQGESTSGSGKAYIGTCDTAQQTAYKIVACQDFELDAGAIIFVKFTYAHVAGVLYLNVNGTGNVQVTNAGETGSMASLWKAGEVVQFVYDGTNWLMIDHVKAGIYNAGIVQLSNSTTSNVETTAATSKAVKAAFDNGGVQSVNGSTGAVTISVPTKTSDLTNDSDYVTSSELIEILDDTTPEITPSLSSGTAIATIKTGETTQTLYAPAGGGSSSAVIISEEYTFAVSFEAGTIGTRGYQGNTTITKSGYTPISTVITYVGASASYMPIAFLGGTNNATLYCNAYRSTTSAVSNSSIRVTVFYALDDGNAVSLNTYNGAIE